MNENPSAKARQVPDLKNPTEAAFVKLFAVGLVGWLAGVLILFGLSWPMAHPESFSSAVIWTISHAWAGFLIGLAAMVVYGVKNRLPVSRAAFAYLLPATILSVIGGGCLLVYPDKWLSEKLLTYLSAEVVFYAFGLLWLRKKTSDTPSLSRAIIPAVVGGLLILGFVAVPVFSSDAFRYRDAFGLKIKKAEVIDGVLFVEGSIEIRKPGNYRFAAPRHVGAELADGSATEPQVENGEIHWASPGAPHTGALGVFLLQIVWRRGVVNPEEAGSGPYENRITVDVLDVDEGNKVIYSISAPMRAE